MIVVENINRVRLRDEVHLDILWFLPEYFEASLALLSNELYLTRLAVRRPAEPRHVYYVADAVDQNKGKRRTKDAEEIEIAKFVSQK